MNRKYCSRCGLNITPNIGKSNVQWMIANRITMCEECNPKLWEQANNMNLIDRGEAYRGKGKRRKEFRINYMTKKSSTTKVIK